MRLFVAIDFPEAVKKQLSALKGDIPAARWVGREQMHLTLFFIGETDHVEAVKATLATIQAPAFDLSLSGVGRFPPGDRRPPRVLWVGLQPQPALMQLQQQVTQALVQLGFEAEERDFNPHITLARLKVERPVPEVTQFLEKQRGFQTQPIAVTQFVLISSMLSPQGARYTHEAEYVLLQG